MSRNIGQWGAPDNLVIHPTLNPGPLDAGFPLSTKWINQSSDSIWFLVDNTSGAAVWVEAGGGSLNLFDVTDPDSTIFPATMTIATATVTVAGHNFENEQEVQFAGAGLPPEIVAGVSYYVAGKTTNTFEITAVRGVAPSIVFSVAGVGTVHTVNGATDIPIVDQYDGVNITLTGPGTDQYIQNPTDIIVHHVFTVANALASTNSIDIYSGLTTVTTLVPGQAQKFIWDGAEWVLGTGIDAEDVDYVPSYGMGSTNVQAAVQEVFTKRNWFAGYNNTLGAIAVGTVVKLADGYDAGGSSFPYITPVTALADIPCGIAAENIAAGAIGQVAFYGMLNVAVNTAAGALGDNVYFDIAGAPTLTAGSSPIGIVNFVNAAGRVFYDFTELTTSGEEGILTVADLATAELLTLAAAATPWIYVTTLDTIYHYNATSAVTRDAKYILNTADAGNTRWEATCGQYVYHSHIGTFGFDALEKETAARTIYLATTGSDTIGDGTVGNPYFSIHRAVKDIRPGSTFTTTPNGVLVTIKLAPGTYDYSALGNLDFSKIIDHATPPRIEVNGNGGTIADSFTIVESGTFDVNGNTEYGTKRKETGKAWVANAYAGMFLIPKTMWTGSVPTVERDKTIPIYGNSADTLYCNAMGATGDTYDIKTYDIVSLNTIVSFGANAVFLPSTSLVTFWGINVTCGYLFQNKYTTPSSTLSGVGNFIVNFSKIAVTDFSVGQHQLYSSHINIATTSTGTVILSGLWYNVLLTTTKSSSTYRFGEIRDLLLYNCTLIQTGATKNYFASCYGGSVMVYGITRLVGFTGLIYTSYHVVGNRKQTAVTISSGKPLYVPTFYHDNAKSFAYVDNQAYFSVVNDRYTFTDLAFPVEPSVGRMTFDNVVDATDYFNEEREINALAIAPASKRLKTFKMAINTDVDAGTEEVDYFLSSFGAKGVRWDITASKAGAVKRMCSINACWNSASTEIADSGEYGIVNIGDTTGISFTVTRETTGPGTVSNAAGGTTVTGVGTRFLNTFKVGDQLTIGADTVTVTAITSATVMTTTAITSVHAAGTAYTFPDRVSLNAVATTNDWEVRAQRYLI